jgi:nicotinamidase/pyrazinamidase
VTSARALLIVDVQPDFLPGGALPVADGQEILPGIAAALAGEEGALAVATQDWHPPGHVSFASAHPGTKPMDVVDVHGHPQTLWPDHCLQGSPGARLAPGLPWERLRAIVRKGTDPDVDSYSGFRNNHDATGARPKTGLAGLLRELGVREVRICGLARDVCCKWTAEDAAEAGFEVGFLWDLTRAVDPGRDDEVRADLERAGVRIL